MKSTEIRIKLLTLKHQAHQKLLDFLASPQAPRCLRVLGCLVVVLVVLVVWQIGAVVWLAISYHRDPVSYLQDYYDPLIPRYLDTSQFRTSEEHVLDLEGYKEELYKLNEFNTYLSDKIPLNRRHKDIRSEGCRIQARKLPLPSTLPKASIVIVMYNEELSTLLRTIVSILNNTPMGAVKEVVVVDDKSSRDELGSQLSHELSFFPFVTLIRNTKREGLIRSRIIGARAAQGKVLVFLDSHVEVLEGWFIPIVARVDEDHKTVVCPIIATIDHTTLELVPDKYSGIWGAWDWDMTFKWRPVPPREVQRRGFDETQPIRTPAMSGGVFAMDKDYFFELGAYDPGMKVWGAENLEMSFRIWMCGGALEINTCSYVGHIFRRSGLILQTVVGETAVSQNTKRLVEVWLDDYKEAYYAAVPGNKAVEAGDYISRVLLRQRLKCRTFPWYLREVYPDQLRPDRDFVGYGEVRGPSKACLDTLGSGTGHQVGVYSCHGRGQNQFWKLSLSGELVNDVMCLDGSGENLRKVVMYSCHGLRGNQQWFLTQEGQLKHGGTGKCLTHDGHYLQLLPCDFKNDRFVWSFSAITEEVQQKQFVLYGKQFNYLTKKETEAKEKEMKRQSDEQLARQKKEREARKRQEEEMKKQEAEEEAVRKRVEEEKRQKGEKEAAKRAKEEEEFKKWKEEKKLREEQVKKQGEEREKYGEERRKREEDQKRNEKEEQRRREEEEQRRKEEEHRRKEEEERKNYEEEKKKKAEEEERKNFEEEKRKKAEEEERKNFEEEKRKTAEEEERKNFEEEKRKKAEEEERKNFEEEKRKKVEEEERKNFEEEKRKGAEEEERKRIEEERKKAEKETKLAERKVEVEEEPAKTKMDDENVNHDHDSNNIDVDIKIDQNDKISEDDLPKDIDLKEFMAWKDAQKKKS